MKRGQSKSALALLLTASLAATACARGAIDLSDEQVEKIVRLSYPYVTMYNVNNKFALDDSAALYSGGWNEIVANTTLMDHDFQSIARPNNDTLYIAAMVDVSRGAMVLEFQSFDSDYVSLMVTAYDHYVNIPMSTTQGHFDKPSRILFYSQRTPGYRGEPVRGVDHVMELSGDFVSAVVRVMPHANEPDRLERNLASMREVRLVALSDYPNPDAGDFEFVLWQAPPGVERDLDVRRNAAELPPFGNTDFDVFEDNLLEVMQFVFNHTTFDPKDAHDQALLAAYEPLGVEPGKAFDPKAVAKIDGKQFRAVAQAVARQSLARLSDPEFSEPETATRIFLPKGEMDQELLVDLSIIGPIGLPAHQALYATITTTDEEPMNAMHDYVIQMASDSLPPANAFWSATLYDSENGFFIPNDSKKYSVGENGGMKLNARGGIEIHVAAEKPDGVPPENWLPVNRSNYGIDVIMRIYAPDLERYKTWSPPKAERMR